VNSFSKNHQAPVNLAKKPRRTAILFLMRHRLHLATARALVVAMFLTLISPHLGWQMVASHDDLTHALTVSTHDESVPHDHDHEAHGFLGHLLSHMPLLFTKAAIVLPAQLVDVEVAALPVASHPRITEPPFVPPRPSFLI
jgi:hypothetical protein